MRDEVTYLLDRGFSYAEIATALGVVKSTVAYHARRIGQVPDTRFARRYDWAQIQEAYDEGLSVRQCAARFGFSLASWHKAVKRGAVIGRPREMDINLLLVAGESRNGRANIKRRILEAGLKDERCEQCGITHWNGRKLSLQLHHVNGDGTDNRLENLELLCPNCHSLTDTYGGRNGHRRTVQAERAA